MLKIVLVSLVLMVGSHSFAEDLEMLEVYTTENFGYGDDGVDCEIHVSDVELLSNSGSALSGESHRLFTYRASQPRDHHGCGLQFKCYALIEDKRSTRDSRIIWGNCSIF